jgi:hypothetical protein
MLHIVDHNNARQDLPSGPCPVCGAGLRPGELHRQPYLLPGVDVDLPRGAVVSHCWAGRAAIICEIRHYHRLEKVVGV